MTTPLLLETMTVASELSAAHLAAAIGYFIGACFVMTESARVIRSGKGLK